MLKHIFLFFSLLLVATTLVAQSAQKFTSAEESLDIPYAKLAFSIDYDQQKELWKAKALRSPSDKVAWLNYYKATRFSNTNAKRKTPNAQVQNELDVIVAHLKKQAPNSYAFHFASFLNISSGEAKYQHLNQAEAIAGKSPELLPHLLGASLIKQRDDETRDLLKLSLQSGQYTSDQLGYASNVLKSLNKGDVLIANGSTDSYPTLVQALEKKQLPSATIINAELLAESEYRDFLIKELRLDNTPKWKGDVNNWLIKVASQAKKEQNKKLHFGLTLPASLLKEIANESYLVGLALKCGAAIDNVTVAEQNWASFDLSHFTSASGFNRNYKPILLLMQQFYSYTQNMEELAVVNQKLNLLR